MNARRRKHLLSGIMAAALIGTVLWAVLAPKGWSPVQVTVANTRAHGSDCVDLVFTNHTTRVYAISVIAETKRRGSWREAYRTRLRLEDSLTWDMDKPWHPNGEPAPWRVRLMFEGKLKPREVMIENLLKTVGLKYPFKHTFEKQLEITHLDHSEPIRAIPSSSE